MGGWLHGVCVCCGASPCRACPPGTTHARYTLAFHGIVSCPNCANWNATFVVYTDSPYNTTHDPCVFYSHEEWRPGFPKVGLQIGGPTGGPPVFTIDYADVNFPVGLAIFHQSIIAADCGVAIPNVPNNYTGCSDAVLGCSHPSFGNQVGYNGFCDITAGP
jgi:hypothetical protein